MIKVFIIAAFLTLSAQAEEFEALKKQPQKTACYENKGSISFDGVKKTYALYDKNSRSVKVINCEKIQIKDTSFYIALFSSEIMEGTEPQKVLTYEVALLDKKSNSLKTVRSETVDQIDTSIDEVSSKFENILKIEWGLSKKTSDILIKIDSHEKNEKSDPFTLKFNWKNQWFENVFATSPVKK